jgi:ribosomal protein S1
MNLQNNKNKYRLLKFYGDAFDSFKMNINCFSLFSNRIIKGKVYNFKNSSITDIGFKYLTFSEEPLLTGSINLKVIKLETALNSLHCDYIKFKNDLAFKLNWSLIKKAFVNKCILKGIILNPIYNGFSVGIWGFVGFVSKRQFSNPKLRLKSVFVITSIDYFKNTFVLSQNRIDKTSPRILLRLSSQLAYISKN